MVNEGAAFTACFIACAIPSNSLVFQISNRTHRHCRFFRKAAPREPPDGRFAGSGFPGASLAWAGQYGQRL